MDDTQDDAGVRSVERKVDALSASVDARFDAVDARFDAVDEAFVEQRQYTEFAFDRLAGEMRAGFKAVDVRFDRLERKLDGFIETQSRTNDLVERRLLRLERTV